MTLANEMAIRQFLPTDKSALYRALLSTLRPKTAAMCSLWSTRQSLTWMNRMSTLVPPYEMHTYDRESLPTTLFNKPIELVLTNYLPPRFIGKTGGEIFHEMMLRQGVKHICRFRCRPPTRAPSAPYLQLGQSR